MAMVKFEEITQKNVRANYLKTDIEGYKVAGNAGCNKAGKLTDANGSIRSMNDEHVASFSIYGEGEYARVSLTDCIPSMMGTAIEVAQATLSDLASTYPQE